VHIGLNIEFYLFLILRIYFTTYGMRENHRNDGQADGDVNQGGNTLTPRSRSEDAVTWLLAYLSSGSVDVSAETLVTVERMTLTPGAIRAVETARAAVEAVQKVGWEEDTVNKQLGARARDVARSLEEVTAVYGHKYHPLVDACAALGLGESAGDPCVRVGAVATLCSDIRREMLGTRKHLRRQNGRVRRGRRRRETTRPRVGNRSVVHPPRRHGPGEEK